MSDPACGHQFSACACASPPDHDGPHVCECLGSWTTAGEILAYPEGLTEAEARAKASGMIDGWLSSPSASAPPYFLLQIPRGGIRYARPDAPDA